MPNGDGPHVEVWESVKYLQESLRDERDENLQRAKELDELRNRVRNLEKALADKVVRSA